MKGRGSSGRQNSADGSSSSAFWSTPPTSLLENLHASPQGLSSEEALLRLNRHGANRLKPKARSDTLALLLAQFKSPIILILVLAEGLSIFVGDSTNAIIIIIIVAVSGLLGFWQERRATRAVERLLALVQIRAKALRDGVEVDIPVEDIVPGDVVALAAGDTIPADCLILEAKDLFVDEATLTGEPYPVEKIPGVVPPDIPLAKRRNCLFMGTHVVSGTSKVVVARTGRDAEFGKVSERLQLRPPETDFERGVRRFGYLLMQVTLFLVVAIFAFNVFLKRPVFDSFLFALALAVGLTPQLLPAVVGVSLSRGAQQMARQKVIVRRLASVENFGSMSVLCSDKTGTLTSGTVQVREALDEAGNASEKVLHYAFVNATFQT